MDLLKETLRHWGQVEEDYKLAPLTTFKIGGRCKYFFIPNSLDSLQKAVKLFTNENIDYHILGAGSNLLISSKGFTPVVVKLPFCEFKKLDNSNLFYVGSSMLLSHLLGLCLENNLGGLEFLAGLPASLGGALVNNASFKKQHIFSLIEKVYVLEPGGNKIFFIDKNSIEYGYKFCSLKKFIVLGAQIRFNIDDKASLKGKMREVMKYRMLTQEVGNFSAGCVFKNPPQGHTAAELIEHAHLKGFKRNDASVSAKHANFIINHKEATSSDVVFLIEYIKEKVHNEFGVMLEEEIERWQC